MLQAIGVRGWLAAAAAFVGLAVLPAQASAFLFVTGSNNLVDVYSIGTDAGLTVADSEPTGAITPRSVAVTPDGKFVYVSSANTFVAGFEVGPTGALTALAGSPFTKLSTDAQGLAIGPDGKFLYVANNNGGAGTISIFSIAANGVLTQVGVDFPVLGGPQGIAISPDGGELFVADSPAGMVSTYKIAADGALTASGLPVAAGANAEGIALTPSGAFLYVSAANKLFTFAVTGDGALSPVGAGVTTANVPETVAVTPDGRFVYVASTVASPNVNGFSIEATGAPTPIPGSPFASFNDAYGVDAAPNGGLYVAAFDPLNPSRVNAFTIGADGVLAGVTGSPFFNAVQGAEFQSVAATPNQGPTAGIGAIPGPAGTPTTFDAAGSVDNDGGTIQEFNWDFGDGDSQGNGGQTLTHVYAQPGTYTASVTVVDGGGCSTTTIFTGQTADCNGNPGAKAEIQVVVPPGAVVLTLSGKKKQKLDRAIEVGAGCDLACTVAGSGDLVVTTKKKKGRQAAARRTFKIKTVSRSVAAGGTVTLRLKLSKNARRAASKALNRRGRVTAKVNVKATSASGVETTSSRSIRLSKKKRK